MVTYAQLTAAENENRWNVINLITDAAGHCEFALLFA